MTAAEETVYIEAAKKGDKSAMIKFISKQNWAFNKLHFYPIYLRADLKQHIYIGLLESVYRFDTSKRFKFSTYARFYVLKEMHNFIYSRTNCKNMLPEKRKKFLAELPQEVDCTVIEIPDYDPIEEKGTSTFSNEIISEALASLTPREKAIIENCVMRDASMREFSYTLGVSRERTRQIKEDALEKIRDYIY